MTDFEGLPPWGVGVGGWGWDSVKVFGGYPMHVCMCTHMHTCTRVMSDDVIMGFPRISLWEQPFA